MPGMWVKQPQPSPSFRWLSHRRHLTSTTWETPRENLPADSSQLTEPLLPWASRFWSGVSRCRRWSEQRGNWDHRGYTSSPGASTVCDRGRRRATFLEWFTIMCIWDQGFMNGSLGRVLRLWFLGSTLSCSDSVGLRVWISNKLPRNMDVTDLHGTFSSPTLDQARADLSRSTGLADSNCSFPMVPFHNCLLAAFPGK